MQEDLTIIIPCRERRSTLKRALEYYRDFDGEVIVADSSKESLSKSFFEGYKNVRYYYDKERKYVFILRDVLRQVNTKYSIEVSDDDFLTLPGISNCIHFLNENKEYSCVYGQDGSLYNNRIEYEFLDYMIDKEGNKEIKNYSVKSRIKYVWGFLRVKNHSIFRKDFHLDFFNFICDNEKKDYDAVRFLDKILSFYIAINGLCYIKDDFFLLRSQETLAHPLRNRGFLNYSPIEKEIKRHLSFENDFLKMKNLDFFTNHISVEEIQLLISCMRDEIIKNDLRAEMIRKIHKNGFIKENSALCRKRILPDRIFRNKCFKEDGMYDIQLPIYNVENEIEKICALVQKYPIEKWI